MIVYHNKKTEPIECVKGCVCMKRIGMLTSGGDCQALNAAMRGVVKGLCESSVSYTHLTLPTKA